MPPGAKGIPQADLHYGRVVSPALLAALQDPLSGVFRWRDTDRRLRDVQLRRQPKGSRSWASLYVGLTSILDIDELGGRFRLRAHATHQLNGGYGSSWPAWGAWQTADQLAKNWPDVLAYLDVIVHKVDARWSDSEGLVHALIADAAQTGVSIVNREASISFRDNSVRQARCTAWGAPIHSAVTGAGHASKWWANLSANRFGTSPDFTGVDASGRLLIIEAKPASATEGIAWGPAQVRFYASMWAAWLDENPVGASLLEEELEQRKALGLLPVGARTTLRRPVSVVPVLAIGPGIVSPEAWSRLRTVQDAVSNAEGLPPAEPLEVWRLSATHPPLVWNWSSASNVAPADRPEDIQASTWSERARVAAVRWKLARLPEAAREDGPYGRTGSLYPFCLPAAQADQNLLAEARDAVDFFADRKIRWHAGIGSGPTNHLLSSQVQCVNALFAMTADPDLVKRAFADVLPISEVLQIEPGAYLTFEYVGEKDYLNEGSRMTRGANRTSTDAAIAYRNLSGSLEIALIEWKYTERYTASKLSGDKKGIRAKRYRAFWDAVDGPILPAESVIQPGPLRYDDIFVEPLYQLVRQQMLAWRMETAREKGVEIARVLHIAPKANLAYQASLAGKSQSAAGTTVSEVWAKMLRHPDRFAAMDSARFLDPVRDLTSEDYRLRYGHD